MGRRCAERGARSAVRGAWCAERTLQQSKISLERGYFSRIIRPHFKVSFDWRGTMRGWLVGCLLLVTAAAQGGTVTGHGRFLKIAGNPAMGYSELYESDLFLSPANNSLMGPVRRLGAPPAPDPTTYDGFYRIDGMPAGSYSVYVNQPDFFISPKVVPNVNIPASGTVTVNVDLDVDYSTSFGGDQQWTEWAWDNYQTFVAKGSSVRFFSGRMAGNVFYVSQEDIV